MKLGLVTIYQVPNYGSVLQAYATQCILESLGVEVIIINYKYPNHWHYKQGIPRPNPIKGFIHRLGIRNEKYNALNKFRKDNYHFSKQYKDYEELKKENWDEYDLFVVGSDQVWKAHFTKGDPTYLLSFLPDDIRRISLASSFASDSIPSEYRELYKQELSKFDALSVRESNGVRIINDELKLGKLVNVVLDPTLLLDKNDWQRLVPRSMFQKKRPYILFYMWAYAFEPRPYIFEVLKHFQNQMDCDIIALEGYTSADQACGVEMRNATTSSIPEFIDLFANSDLVITSSFHGTAFALNFGIPLISVVPDNDGDDRQSTLLRLAGADNCILKNKSPIRNINPLYDQRIVLNRLKEQRLTNLNWIATKIG